MGSAISYTNHKAALMYNIAKDTAALHFGDSEKWPDVTFWVDKCCVPQNHRVLRGWCIALLEYFIQMSEGMVAVLTWSYFDRMWCAYEWVCFLACHEPGKVTICIDSFLRTGTLPLFIESIRNFRIEDCKCFCAADRKVLEEKIQIYFASPAGFDIFLKFTAISIIVRDLAVRRYAYGTECIFPWARLAEDCKFRMLASKLRSLCELMRRWQRETALSLDTQSAIRRKVHGWFGRNIDPLIEELRMAVLLRDTRSSWAEHWERQKEKPQEVQSKLGLEVGFYQQVETASL